MEDRSVTSLASFDIENGVARKVNEKWPSSVPEGNVNFRWLHFDLSESAVETWMKESVPEVACHSILQEETRPRCDRLGEGLILNLRGVNLNPNSSPDDMVSLRMWVGKKSIVSARMRKVWAVDAMRAAAESGKAPKTEGLFLVELTNGLTDRIEKVILEIEEQTDELEESVLQSSEILLGQLTALRQTAIKMRRFINPQKEALEKLSSIEDWIITKNESLRLREVSNRTRRLVEQLDAVRDRLTALQEHIDAERSHALSRNSYLLSVVAAIFLPLGFLTGLFGVNIAGMPGTETPLAFWLLTAVSIVSGILLYLIFKISKWL